jgi:hypothetical protein
MTRPEAPPESDPPAGHAASPRRRPPWRWFGAGAATGVLLGATIVLLVVRISGPELKQFTREHLPALFHVIQTVFEIDQSAGPELGINLNEVAGNPREFYGEPVTVSGVVSQVLDPHAIVLGHEGLRVSLGGPDETLVITEGDQLLVVTPDPWPAGLTRGVVARVTGTVLPFELARFEMRFGVDFQHHDTLAEWDGDAAIVAQSLALDPPVPGHGDPEDPADMDGPEYGITIHDVLDDPDRYLGRTVTLSAEAEEVYTPHAFKLSDADLLVVSPRPLRFIVEEATAYVTGTARIFDAEALEHELGVDLEAGALEKYVGKPVIVTRSIRVVR